MNLKNITRERKKGKNQKGKKKYKEKKTKPPVSHN